MELYSIILKSEQSLNQLVKKILLMNKTRSKSSFRTMLTVFAFSFVLLSQMGFFGIKARALTLGVQVTTNKDAYSLGESVRITGNVTLDGVLQNSSLAGVEVVTPFGDPYVIRTVDTGNISEPSYFVQIAGFYTCDYHGNPQTLFSRNSLGHFNLTIRNVSPASTYHVKTGIYAQSANNTPLLAFFPQSFDLAPNSTWILLNQFFIPDGVPTGQARFFASVFNTSEPSHAGPPLCPERSANFSIENTTPLFPQQPQHFNLTFNFPIMDVIRGDYIVYATAGLGVQNPKAMKVFSVAGPECIFSYTPFNPIIYQPVTFDGTASYDPNGTITDWHWNFGDDTGGAGSLIVHAYEIAGIYTASLTVTDNYGGSNTTSALVIVTEAWAMFHHDPKRSGASTSLSPVTNRTIWSKTVGPNAGADILMYSSVAALPATLGNVVFVASTNGTVYALNAATGALNWTQTPAPGFAFHSSSAFAEGIVFIGCDNGVVYALNASNGSVKYSIATGGAVYSSPAIDAGKVFVSSLDGKIYAFRSNGTNLWTSTLDGSVYSSPAVSGGAVFVGTSNGTMFALNETSGATLWKNNITPGSIIYSSPAIAYGRVFFGSSDGKVYALNAGNGTASWNITTSSAVYSSPSIADGIVFVGSLDGNLYALDVSTGTLFWYNTIGPIKWSSPLVAEGKVFVGTTDGRLFALREGNGYVLWTYQTGGALDSSPALLSEVIFACSKDGKVYAFSGQVDDIAVRSVTPSKSLIFQNETITITIDLWNRGSFNEIVSLASSRNNTVFNNTSINIGRGQEIMVQISFDTTGLAAGTYVIMANASLVPPVTDAFPSDNIASQQVAILIGIHDVSVNNVTSSKTVIGKGYGGNMTISVQNQGNYTETFIVTFYANSTSALQINVNLTAGSSTVIYLVWNTGFFAHGNYTLKATAAAVSGETDTADNTFVLSVPVHVGIPGDISGAVSGVYDGVTNMRDINYLILRFNARPDSPNWKPNLDVNNDGVINMRDIQIAIANFNKRE